MINENTNKELLKEAIIQAIDTNRMSDIVLKNEKYITIEDSELNDDTLVIKFFDNKKEYIKRNWEVKDEDIDILYINVDILYSLLYKKNKDGIFLKSNFLEIKGIDRILDNIIYYILDYIGVNPNN